MTFVQRNMNHTQRLLMPVAVCLRFSFFGRRLLRRRVRVFTNKRPRETKWTYDNERGGFTITTLHRIRGGSQVYDSYGQKCNHRFLLNYGFAIEANEEANGFCPNEVRQYTFEMGGGVI